MIYDLSLFEPKALVTYRNMNEYVNENGITDWGLTKLPCDPTKPIKMWSLGVQASVPHLEGKEIKWDLFTAEAAAEVNIPDDFENLSYSSWRILRMMDGSPARTIPAFDGAPVYELRSDLMEKLFTEEDMAGLCKELSIDLKTRAYYGLDNVRNKKINWNTETRRFYNIRVGDLSFPAETLWAQRHNEGMYVMGYWAKKFSSSDLIFVVRDNIPPNAKVIQRPIELPNNGKLVIQNMLGMDYLAVEITEETAYPSQEVMIQKIYDKVVLNNENTTNFNIR